MGWSNNAMADEDKVKWNIAMKFLIPAKFDVSRAIELYQTHEVSENSNDREEKKLKVLVSFRISVKMNISIAFGSIILV